MFLAREETPTYPPEEIRQRRIEMGLNREQLGVVVGASKNTIVKWENGGSTQNELHKFRFHVVVLLWEKQHPQLLAYLRKLEKIKGGKDFRQQLKKYKLDNLANLIVFLFVRERQAERLAKAS